MASFSNPEQIVAALSRSPFRRKFRLSAVERAALRDDGLAVALRAAHASVVQRLSAAAPEHEGRQTPFRGHPVFIAQHGTATCCRRCLEKWHHIPSGVMLSAAQEDYVVGVIACWLRAQLRPLHRPASSASASA